MPSLRVQRVEEARKQRIERIERARKYGIVRGKKCAESYRACVEATEDIVVSAVCEKILKKKIELQAMEDRVMAQNSLRQGEGMRGAYEFSENLAARALEERAAWNAEYQLQSARNVLASKDMNIRNMKEVLSHVASEDKRAKAKEMELDRSRKVLLLKGKEKNIECLAVNDVNVGGGRIKVFTPSHISAEEAAASYATKRNTDIQTEKHNLLERQRNTRERAIIAIGEKRADMEKERQAEEHDRLLKQRMMDNAMRSVFPQKSPTFQEQDARHSTETTDKIEKEFEETFLNGPWSKEIILKHHESAMNKDDVCTLTGTLNADEMDGKLFDPICLRNLSSLSNLDGGASVQRLLTHPFPTKEILPELLIGNTNFKNSDECCIVGVVSDSCQNVLPNYEDDEPTPQNGMVPEPMPTTIVSVQSDSNLTSSNVSLPPIGSRASSIKRPTGSSEERDMSDDLQERNAQFLRELGLLQRRLQHAKSLTAKLHSSYSSPYSSIPVPKTNDCYIQGTSALVSCTSEYESDIESNCLSPMSTPEKGL